MYERFTDRALEIVRQASALAIEGQQERISADHLFLSLLASDGTARLILSAIGADVEGLSSSIAKIVRKHPESITFRESHIQSVLRNKNTTAQLTPIGAVEARFS